MTGPSAQLLADIAASQLGVSEEPRGSNRGPWIERYQAACALAATTPTGWPWCAAFVCWAVQEWLRQLGDLAPRIAAPREAAVSGLLDWGRATPGVRVFRPTADDGALPGDLAIYTFSHCGIVRRPLPGSPSFIAVEGNTNTNGSREGYEVAQHPRSYLLVRALIRLPLRAKEVA